MGRGWGEGVGRENKHVYVMAYHTSVYADILAQEKVKASHAVSLTYSLAIQCWIATGISGSQNKCNSHRACHACDKQLWGWKYAK